MFYRLYCKSIFIISGLGGAQQSSFNRAGSSTDDSRQASSSSRATPGLASTNKFAPAKPQSSQEAPAASANASRFRRAESEDQTLSTSFRYSDNIIQFEILLLLKLM